MAIIKVLIKDKNTLELQENAVKGDLIDLGGLGTVDVSSVTEAMKTAARKEIESESILAKEKEVEAALLRQSKEFEEKRRDLELKLQARETEVKISLERQRAQENQKALEIKQAVTDIQTELKIKESQLKEQFERELKTKDEQISYYKDLKLKQNSKMLGETVERHCHLAFEQVRGLLPASVKFGKDTDASEGSMGDRIYREFDENNNEVLSIMFEMKNEGDETKTKQTNEQFFKELDKDRTQKKCEYAVLVTMLEKDNELYDSLYTVPEGLYKDMFVIRPQSFVKIIMWLRHVSRKLSSSRTELLAIKQRDIDYAEWDNNLEIVKNKFSKHVTSAGEKFKDAIEYIDKTIKNLENTKAALLGTDKQLQLATGDLDEFAAKKLAKNSPTVLKQLKNQK